jgi:hypothetical protein
MSLDKEYIEEMERSFDCGKDIYCWCLLDKNNLEHTNMIDVDNYYTLYFRGIEKNVPNIANFYVKDSDVIHSPGSFVWYDMKNIYGHIGNILDIISLDSDILKSSDSATHYCELYIWRFLNIENIQEQTFINNIRNEFRNIRNSPYTQLYCSKKICYKYIKDFDKYIIQNKII